MRLPSRITSKAIVGLFVLFVSGCIGTPKPPPPTDFPRLFAPPPVVLRPISALRVNSTITVPEAGMFLKDNDWAEVVRQFTELRESDRVLREEIEEYGRWRKARQE